MDNHSYLKVAQEETCTKQACGKNDIGILGFSKTWKYFLSLMDTYSLLSYNAGHRAGWGLPATSLCVSTDNAFFVIRLKFCNSLFPWHFFRVNCLSAVFPQYPPSHISFIILIILHYNCNICFIYVLYQTADSLREEIFSVWIQLVNEICKELSG